MNTSLYFEFISILSFDTVLKTENSYFSTSSFGSRKSTHVLLLFYTCWSQVYMTFYVSCMDIYSRPSSSTYILKETALSQCLGRLAGSSVLRCALPSSIIFLAESVSNLLMRPLLSKVSIIDLMVEYFLPRILAMSHADMRCAR